MSEERKHRHYHTGGSLAGAIWFIGWLFTCGFANLIWWQWIVGLVIWPYFLGVALIH